MSPFAVETVGHVEQLVDEHAARSPNAVMVGAAACPSHVETQVGSVGKQLRTQVAIVVQAASLGQLVGLRQQLEAMQAMHAAFDVPKISVAPGQAAPSPLAPVVPSSDVDPSLAIETPPPPPTPAEQGTPSTGVHPPRIGGCGSLFDEQANTAPRSPAIAGPTIRVSARVRLDRPKEGADDRSEDDGTASMRALRWLRSRVPMALTSIRPSNAHLSSSRRRWRRTRRGTHGAAHFTIFRQRSRWS
jgi:hypothetical protein